MLLPHTHTDTPKKTHKRLKLPITRHTQDRAGQTDRLGATQSELAKPRTLSPPAFVSLSLSLFNWLSSRAMAECLATLPRSPRSLPLPLPQAREPHSLLPGSCFVDWHTHTRTHTQTRGHMALPVNVGIKICLSCDDTTTTHTQCVCVRACVRVCMCVCASFIWPYNRYNNKNNANALCALTQFPFLDTAQQAHQVGDEIRGRETWRKWGEGG